jgi:hypothetical protein
LLRLTDKGRLGHRTTDSRISCRLFGTLVEVADWFPEQKGTSHAGSLWRHRYPHLPGLQNPMRLTKRTPHPKHGYEFELQTFTCGVCQHEIERDADILGEVLA